MKEIIIKDTTYQLTKHYYSIGEVSKMFGVATSLIRYWETEFKILNPKKNKNGERQFTTYDIDTINSIYNLVKLRGFTLEGAAKELKSSKNQNNEQVTLVKQKLERLKAMLLKHKA